MVSAGIAEQCSVTLGDTCAYDKLEMGIKMYRSARTEQ